MTNPNTTARAPTKDELAAYAEWLFMEFRLLSYELWPEPIHREMAEAAMSAGAPVPLAFPFKPSGTAAATFHLPTDGRSWRDVPKPSTRCLQVLDAVGVKIEQ